MEYVVVVNMTWQEDFENFRHSPAMIAIACAGFALASIGIVFFFENRKCFLFYTAHCIVSPCSENNKTISKHSDFIQTHTTY